MLLRQTILYLPAQVVGPVAQVVASIVWTHWLGVAPYGLLTFLIASQELVFLLSLSWWTQYTMRYLGGFDAAERQSFARSETPILVLSFGVQIIVTLVVLLFLHQHVTPLLVLMAIAYVATRTLLVHLGERARIKHRIAIYTLGQLAGSIVGFVLALVGVAFISATPEAVLGGFALSQLVGLILMWRALGLTPGGLLPRRDVLAAAFHYGLPLLVAGGFAWFAQNGIRIVVEWGAGADALGLIAVGWTLGQRLATTLAMLVVAASFPLAVQSVHGGSREEAYRQLSLGGALLTGLIVPASVGLCILAPPFVTLFVAEPFRAATIAVLPYAAAAGALRNIRIHIADPVFLLIERPRVATLISIIDMAAAVFGCAIGLYLGGIVGASAGAMIGTAISSLAGFILAARLAGFGFPFEDGIRIGAASVLMALALIVVPWGALRLPPLAQITAETLIGVAVYGLAIAALYPAITRHARRRLTEVFG